MLDTSGRVLQVYPMGGPEVVVDTTWRSAGAPGIMVPAQSLGGLEHPRSVGLSPVIADWSLGWLL